MRAVVFGDAHVDGGFDLGEHDEEWVNTRLRNTQRILHQICSTDCDVLIFLGDIAVHPTPDPAALSLTILQGALAESPASAVGLCMGNHDHDGRARSCLDVVAAALRQDVHVFRRAELVTLGGLQVGALPWAPPQRFYTAHTATLDGNRQVAAALADLARGLGARLDPTVPSFLGAHWFLAGSVLASGEGVLGKDEPLLSVPDLEASGCWGAIVGAHNHRHQQVGDRTWVCGAPKRDDFGEQNLLTGFLIIDYDGVTATVQHVPTDDVTLRMIQLNPDDLIAGVLPNLEGLDGARVKLMGTRTETQAAAMLAAGCDVRLLEACVMAGAANVSGPKWTATRERRARTELAVDVEPETALIEWLDDQDLPKALRDDALRECRAIMTGSST